MIPDIEAVVAAQKDWANACASGSASAQRSAASAFTVAAGALAKLRANLRTIGFDVADPAAIDGVDANIAKLEAALGFAPPEILQLMWRTIGEVSVIDMDAYGHRRFWDAQGVKGPNGATDGVLLYGCDASYARSTIMEIEDFVAEGEAREYFLLPLAPDSFHKDDVSGGSSYGLNAVSDWSAPLENFMWMAKRPTSAPESAVDLLSYLRISVLECAGFPGLLGVPAFEPFRQRLLEGLPVF